MEILRGDPVSYDRSWKIRLKVKPYSALRSCSDEVLYEVHAAAGLHPFPVRVRISFCLHNYIRMEEYVAVESEVSERSEPCRRRYELVANDERHLKAFWGLIVFARRDRSKFAHTLER